MVFENGAEMKHQAGYQKKIRAAAIFSDREILSIRKADREGTATRREQARLWGVSVETIARICRGDTYHWIVEQEELLDQRIEAGITATEPTKEEIQASQEKLLKMLKEQGLMNAVIQEVEQKGDLT